MCWWIKATEFQTRYWYWIQYTEKSYLLHCMKMAATTIKVSITTLEDTLILFPFGPLYKSKTALCPHAALHSWTVVLSNISCLMCLVGNVCDMLATCRADTSMSANFSDIPFFCRHPFLPIWPFPRVLMSGNANISIGTRKYKTIYNTQNRLMGCTDWIQLFRLNSVFPSHPYFGMMPWRSSEAQGIIL